MTTRKQDKRIGSIWEPVEATPEEIALACMQWPPKEQWDYLTKTPPPDEDDGGVV